MTSADRQSAVQARLLKRYRDEARFRAFGIAAIVFALAMLALPRLPMRAREPSVARSRSHPIPPSCA